MESAHFRIAERLILTHATSNRLRTLDALQLAVVMSLRTFDQSIAVVSADASLLKVATNEGLVIVDPTLEND